MSDDFDCDSLKGLKRMLCQGYKYDTEGNEIELTPNEHARWMASFQGKPVPPREKVVREPIRRQPPKKEGVGTELERLFHTVRFATCGACKALRDQMNEWGPDGCREHRDEIIDKLKQNARRRKILRHVFSESAAHLFLDQAITNAELREDGMDPPVNIFENVIDRVSKVFSPKKKVDKLPRSLVWSYGVTTVPSREKELLPRTLESLASGGFDSPHLFIDGCEDLSRYEKYGLPMTAHTQNVRTFGNWVMALWELYVLNPQADRFAIFQDDMLTYPNLRDYLDSCKYPHNGYLNLITSHENTKIASSKSIGWHKASQRGRGAVGLVFSREAVTTLLSHDHMVNRPKSRRDGHRKVDGGIVESFRKAGWAEYIHNPSLVQHIGHVSSMGNPQHPAVTLWNGEEFDALRFTEGKPVKKRRTSPAVTLVGYRCRTGLGELNRQIATYCDIENWLIKGHKNKPENGSPSERGDINLARGESNVSTVIDQSDVILFCETPYFKDLTSVAKSKGKRVVCVPMIEWTPRKGWVKDVDLFICPTVQCYEKLKTDGLPCVLFPWPVDSSRFKHRSRNKCEKFLFLNGNGGWNERKGLAPIVKATKLWPEFPLVVRSQRNVRGLKIDSGEVASNQDLYSLGDVLISPHTVDGLGLEPMEAMACGMPVISTDGQPWNEIPSIGKIQCETSQMKIARDMDWHICDPQSIVDICKRLLGQDISKESDSSREWAESLSWESRSGEFFNLVVNGAAI